jgi:hypothetical protein
VGLVSPLKIKRQLQHRAIYRQNFIAAPLGVSLLYPQIFYKSHVQFDLILPIKHKKEPLDKVLEGN